MDTTNLVVLNFGQFRVEHKAMVVLVAIQEQEKSVISIVVKFL